MRSSCKTQSFMRGRADHVTGVMKGRGVRALCTQGGDDRDDDNWWKVSRLCRCVKHIFSPSLSLSSLCHRRYTLSSVVSIYLVAGCPHVHRIARWTITQRKVFKNWNVMLLTDTKVLSKLQLCQSSFKCFVNDSSSLSGVFSLSRRQKVITDLWTSEHWGQCFYWRETTASHILPQLSETATSGVIDIQPLTDLCLSKQRFASHIAQWGYL